MKLRIEIPDADGSDDWVCHRELALVQRHSDTPELLEACDQSVVLPNGEALQVSCQYRKHNAVCWIMVEEGGKHKASIEARCNDLSPRLVFTTSENIDVRLTVVQ